MDMNERINKQRLFDYFAGKATGFEKQQIEEWSREPTHEEQFYSWLDEWEQAYLQYTTDQPVALSRYHDFLFADHPSATNASPPVEAASQSIGQFGRRNWLVWLVAASMATLIVFWGFHEQLLTRTYETRYGETRTVTLPDGSSVTLNSNSLLQVSRFGFGKQWFDIQSRQVRLSGEAFFSVTHTATNQRFVVKTDNGPEVVVLGTEFTVFARARGTKVALNRGKVVVHYQQPDQRAGRVVMKPGDLLTFTPKGDMHRQQTNQVPANPAWTEHRFVFDKTTLTEIAAMLTENYGVHVKIADAETSHLTLSGAYTAQNANEMLCIIAEVLNLSITQQNSVVVLSPKAI